MEIPNRDPEESYLSEIRAERAPTGSAGGWTPPTVEEIAELFPHYEVLQLIAHGGMGAVYRARQISLDREVAIKLLPIEVSGDQGYADRFVREGRAMAKLSHPNIVTVFDFGTTSEGQLFLVMEFIDGATFNDFIHARSLTSDQSLYVIEQVCEALAYAHSLGIVHRDIKPANVMVDRSLRAKVADFGLARITENNAAELGITMTGQVMGTPNYIAPEQLEAMNVDHRADIYSLGVMLYESIAHEVPRGIFLPLSKRTGADPRLDTIVTRAMQQHPDLRFQSTQEMKALVTSVRTTRRPAATHPHPPKKSKAPLWIGIAVAAVAGIAALIFFMLDPGKRVVESMTEPVREVAKSPLSTPIVEIEKSAPVVSPPPVTVAPIPEPTPAPMPEPKAEPPPTPLPPSEIAKWLAQVEEQYGGPYRKEVLEPYESGLAKLREQYTAALTRSSATASTAGKLDEALALRTEQARLTANRFPHQNPDEPTDPAVLRQLRDNWRKAFSKLDLDRFTKAKLAHARYDAALAQNQKQLTQRQQLDDALLVKQKREKIASWLQPPFDTSKPVVSAPTPSIAPKPLGSAKPTSDLLTGREAFEHLYGLVMGFWYMASGAPEPLMLSYQAKAEELPKGRVEITSLEGMSANRRDGVPISDADFAKLGPLRKLTSFRSLGNLTGSGLGFLAESPDLNNVNITSAALTSAALDPLLGLRKINSLVLTGFTEPTSWTRFGELSALPTLTVLEISHAETIPPAALSRARKLRTATFTASTLTEEHFAALALLPDLESLALSGQVEAGAAGFKHLEKCPKLTKLNLVNCRGISPHLGFIGNLRKLTTLTVEGSEVPGLAAAAGAPALREIQLGGTVGSQGCTNAGLQTIATSFPRLENLVFIDFTVRTVTAEGIRELTKLPRLKSLTWGKHPVPLAIATELAALPALENLTVASCQINETHLAEFAKSKTLTYLDIAFGELTPTTLSAAMTLRGLRDLNVTATGITDEQLATLRAALPKCNVRR